jgi:dienelactone hydrolase
MTARRIALVSLLGWLVLALAGGVGVAAAAPPHQADGTLSEWDGQPTMLSGESRISRGELIYTDWLYDDYGADLDNAPNQTVFRGLLAPTRGDYRYPEDSDRYGFNAADIRELRVAADANELHLLVFLQTMKVSDATALTLAIDRDRNPDTGRKWPDGVGIDKPGAGVFVTFWGTGGWITTTHGPRQPLLSQAVNLNRNAIEVDIPWSSLPSVRGRNVRLHLVSGLVDVEARRYQPVPADDPTPTTPGGGAAGSTAAFDAAFDADEVSTRAIGSHWGEERQSQALAARDVSDLGHTVDLRALETGASDSYAPEPGRFYNRIFRSTKSYGEGISLRDSTGGRPDPQFLSRFQPYGLYIPSDYQPGTPAPLLLNGHSLDVNQNEYAVVSPNLYNQLGDQRSSLVFTPLARGTDTWYISSGFFDVLEAWEDVKANYTTDPLRTHITGYSMGGYMSYRIGLLMPDRFATSTPYVGPPAYQIWVPPAPPQPSGPYQFVGNTNHIVTNALNLPFEINAGGADELVPPEGPQEQARTFRELGRPHRFYFYPNADHFFLILADEWGHTRDFLTQHEPLNTNPLEVAYRRFPAMDLPALGLRFDGAYWVDRMAVRSPSDSCSPGAPCQTSFGQVDAITFARGGNRTEPQQHTSAYPGPPAPATVTGIDRVPAGAIIKRNGFEAKLTNLARVAFNMGRMGINPAQRIGAALVGDGATTLILLGAFPPVAATLDGQPVPVRRSATAVEVDVNLAPGRHQLVVTPS